MPCNWDFEPFLVSVQGKSSHLTNTRVEFVNLTLILAWDYEAIMLLEPLSDLNWCLIADRVMRALSRMMFAHMNLAKTREQPPTRPTHTTT